jgi:exosome complex RNA-binding protein Rrp42 (RNase PH superfamily)
MQYEQDALLSNNERDFIVKAVRQDVRLDGRSPYDCRKLRVQVRPAVWIALRQQPGSSSEAWGSTSWRLRRSPCSCKITAPHLATQFALDDHSATVQLGGTTALAAISAELTAPYQDRGREGAVRCGCLERWPSFCTGDTRLTNVHMQPLTRAACA